MHAPTSQIEERHTCPYCHTASLETLATAPYVRGLILDYQIWHKSFIGCIPCVRKKVFQEAGESALVGWFSIPAMVINPFLITYNLLQGAFLLKKSRKVRKKLQELGIPDERRQINLTNIGYAMAISMIKADGKVQESEVRLAEKIGGRIFEDFDEAKFRLMVNSSIRIPATRDMAHLLKDILNEQGRKLVFEYLAAIAQADGQIDSSEQHMLIEIAKILEISVPSSHV